MNQEKITYDNASKTIIAGFYLLGLCFKKSILNHKALSTTMVILIISIVINVCLSVISVRRQAECERVNKDRIILENKVDSLEGRQTKYVSFNTNI